MTRDVRTVVICGATGYIGQYLARAYRDRGIDVRSVGRGAVNDASWSDRDRLTRVLDGADMVINLAGRSVSCRYTKSTADVIFSSRVETTAALGQALSRVDRAPDVWFNASTGTIYRDARDRPMTERDGDVGTGFSVEVARAWERELFDAPTGVRKIALRMAIVLGAGGGAVNPLIDLARLGLGGRMGDGTQMFSWIHVADVLRSIDHLYAREDIAGPVNLATPFAVDNATMMREVRRHLGRSRGVATPAWLLHAGAAVIRTEPELVLKSRWVDPEVLRRSDFEFEYPRLGPALEQIARHTSRGLLPVTLG